MDTWQTSFFQLQSIGTKMVGPGFRDCVGFHHRERIHLSGVALVSPNMFNVVAPDSEEPIEELRFPNVGSTSDVPSDTAFYFYERSVMRTDGSKMIRTTTDGVEEAIPSGQSNRVHVFTPGSSVSIDPPTILADGSEVSFVVDEGAFLDMARHCFVQWKASSECVKRDESRRVRVPVLSMMHWYV